ncbi:MAG TPA: tRNA pseudouridine(54/55) synthase Pus10 [Candidatus Bathyarchaeia archaeon]|nr:MAG: hypothetical protein A3K70_03050 [Candidatus Bathyarchaeota archaeon RBG_16_48_13]HJX23524.1 tRNA pseudouridine(54/55) synthase Pus10 [Candidatus Bathyarchaeia archaeon]
MKVLDLAKAIIEKYPLCDHCLGRQFALLMHGTTNCERGKIIKDCLAMEGHALALDKKSEGIELLESLVKGGSSKAAAMILQNLGREEIPIEKSCYLCSGKFEAISRIADVANQKISHIGFNTFLVGVKIASSIIEKEDELRSQMGIKWGETIRNEFSREIGKELTKVTKREFDLMRPDVVIMVNPFSEEVTFQINPLYISGRYRKLAAGISQSKSICGSCGGKGCPKCNGAGTISKESVEEYIAKPLLQASKGSDEKFHAAGRENADTRIMGTGRPFILEIKNPLKRDLRLHEICEEIQQDSEGKIIVAGLSVSGKENVRRLKAQGELRKTYRIVVEFENPLSDINLARLQEGVHRYFEARRPSSPNKMLTSNPEKQIYETNAKKLTQNSIEITISATGGRYVKELVGKQGEFKDNFSQIIENPTRKMEFEVIDIVWNDER